MGQAWRSPAFRAALRVAAPGLLLLLTFQATLHWLVQDWLANPYYSHGFLVPVVALFFLWRAARRTPAGAPGSLAGALIALPALAVHLAALKVQAFYLSALMLAPVILGLVLLQGSWQLFRRLFFPALLLELMVPLPFVPSLSPPLEAFAAGGAAALGRLAGLAVSQSGSEVGVPGQAFVVGAPCSGLYSVVALSSLALIFLYLIDGELRGRIALLLLTPLIALAANLVRIALLLGVAQIWGGAAALGYYHTLSSPILFALAIGCLIGASHLFRCDRIRPDIF